MKTKTWLFLLSIFLIFLTIPLFYIVTFSQADVLPDKKVVYDLPYPGILPDNPLYFLKVTRDRILDWTTRDLIKKAELYLLFSDKRVNMASSLIKKGKTSLAISTLSKGEKYFDKIPNLISTSKKMGTAPSSDLVSRLKLSNAKHAEVMMEIKKQLPKGEENEVDATIVLNKNIRKLLNRL